MVFRPLDTLLTVYTWVMDFLCTHKVYRQQDRHDRGKYCHQGEQEIHAGLETVRAKVARVTRARAIAGRAHRAVCIERGGKGR